MKTNRSVPLLLATVALLGAPCQAIVISVDPLSNDNNVFGTWHQRREGADDGMWYLPGGIILELGVGRDGPYPQWSSDQFTGRWDTVFCMFSVDPWEARSGWIYNDADHLADDVQSRTTQGFDSLSYTFSFDGEYFPDSDEWDGTFSAVVSRLATHRVEEVPEGGGSLILLCGAMAGVFLLKRRWT